VSIYIYIVYCAVSTARCRPTRAKRPASPVKEPYITPKRALLTLLLRSGAPKELYITHKEPYFKLEKSPTHLWLRSGAPKEVYITHKEPYFNLKKSPTHALAALRCAVVYGSLPPDARKEQARIFNSRSAASAGRNEGSHTFDDAGLEEEEEEEGRGGPGEGEEDGLAGEEVGLRADGRRLRTDLGVLQRAVTDAEVGGDPPSRMMNVLVASDAVRD